MVSVLKPFHAPSRLKFLDPDTGHVYTAKTREQLVQQIVAYRAQNELGQIENLHLVLDAYLCAQPENWAKCEERPLKRGLLAYFKGGVTLIQNMLFDSYASQSLADERSEICRTCPHNIMPTNKEKGALISWSDTLASHTIGDRKSSAHDKLGNCSVCSCLLKSKVWVGGKVTLPKEEEDQLIPECWQRPENQKEI